MIAKIRQLQNELIKADADAILISSAVSHRYLAKFDNPDGYLIITTKNAYALEDFRYIEVAKKQLSEAYTVVELSRSRLYDHVNEIVDKEEIKTLLIEDLCMPLAQYKGLKENVNATLDLAGAMVNSLREVKDETEIAKVKEAQRITDIAFDHVLKMITPDMTEKDVATELEYIMRKNGADDKSFDTIAVSGVNSSLPHGVPGDIKLNKGFLTMDFGALVDGYHADMTRTICIGKADAEMKKLYNTVLSAQLAALDVLKAGMLCSDADKVARDIIDKEYKGCFGHSLGHSVGLEIHEGPNLSSLSNRILLPGNIVTVEPGIYVEGKYGCRIEDLVVIQENSILNLTKSPKELIEIY